MSIGTAKPSIEEQKGIKHYFIDSNSISEDITAASFAKNASKVLDEEFKNHDTLILVGGSGMFIDALTIGLDEIPSSKELRDDLSSQVKKEGLEPLLKELEEKDPEFYTKIDRNNPVRVIRAIEAIRLSGQSFSSMRKSMKKEVPYEIKRFVIEHQREKLYERINLRVDQMMEKGLLKEVQNLWEMRHLNSLKTVGYTELFAYLDGHLTLPAAIDLIKQNSRRYAKRQLTWFRKHEDAVWIDFDSTNKMTEKILTMLKND